MKRYVAVLAVILLFLASLPLNPVASASQPSIDKLWALIVCGYLEFQPDCQYIYDVLTEHYNFSDIAYLTHSPSDPRKTFPFLDKNWTRWHITDWLGNRSDSDDLIFIYIMSHGGGFNGTTFIDGEPVLEGGRIDGSGDQEDPQDEGNEHQYQYPNETYFGVDECISIWNGSYPDEAYWDDEVRNDLANLTYGKLIFFYSGCKVGNQSCFSGGFIDDLSAENRIIITPCNETSHAYGYEIDDDPLQVVGNFSRPFIDALNPEIESFNEADFNNDEVVSMWEAFQYAFKEDKARQQGLETPWLDDNGNGLPTYKEEHDVLDETDGLFSYETYLGFDPIKSVDTNGDHLVDIFDKVKVGAAFGATYNATDGMYWHQPPDGPCSYCPHTPNADLRNDFVIDIYDKVIVGNLFGREYSGGSRGFSGPSQRGTAEVSIDPSEITVNKYGIFSANITVNDVTDLYGWEFTLYWNSAILNCTSAQIHIPDSWDENTDEADGGIQNDFNVTHGRYWKALSARYPATPFNGSMAVVTLTFEAKAVGSSVLDLQNTKLADVYAEAINHTASDGSVNVLSQRYMRGDQHTVNNLNAYKLAVPQSAIYKTVLDGAAGRKTIYWGIRVWKRGSAGNETEITGGIPVAQVSRSSNGEGLQSNTWSCPQTPLQSTDAIVVRVYMKFGSGEWQLCSTFITERLQASQLDSVQWTVYYYTWRFYDRWEGITSGSYDWGTTTYNSHIQNFQYT